MNPQATNPVGRPPLSDQERQIQLIHSVMESCPFKFATSGVIGKCSAQNVQPTKSQFNIPIPLTVLSKQVSVWVLRSVFSCHPLSMLVQL
jgi:hypothetical protein